MPLWHIQIALALLLVLGLAGRRASSFGEIAASILPQTAAACWLVCLAALAKGQPLAGVLPFAIAGAALWGAREQFAASDAPIPDPDARIIWANLFSRPTALRLVVALAERENADAVAFGEFPPHLTGEQRTALLGPFTHEIGAGLTAQTNVAIFSRHPIEAEAIADAGERPALFARINVRGASLTIAAVHPRVPYLPSHLRRREETIRTALAAAAAREPCVLVGDFNTVPWSRTLRDVRRAGLAHRAQMGNCTWVTPWPIAGLPIDQAFVLGPLEIAVRAGPFIWSDHYPLIVDIRLPR
jgi:endonuclease/exonuclease/phosphatase (EEP) superfamily protein YafD